MNSYISKLIRLYNDVQKMTHNKLKQMDISPDTMYIVKPV
jgi:hypothetical protein